MNQQITDIINTELDPVLNEFTNLSLSQSNVINTPLKAIRQSNIVEIQNVHTKYKRIINETIQKIIIEIEKYYQALIERNQAINFKLYTRIAEQQTNMSQLQEMVNQLTLENQEFRLKTNEEEVGKEFYDPQQQVIRQQKQELLECYDLNDQLSNKLKRQSSISLQLEDKLLRQNSKIFCLEEQVKQLKRDLEMTKQQNKALQTQISQMQLQINDSQYVQKQHLSGELQSSRTRTDIIGLTQIHESSEEKQNNNSDSIKIPNIQRFSSIEQETQATNRQSRRKNKSNYESIQQQSDYEINHKQIQKQQEIEIQEIMRNKLYDIQDIIKPKYKRKPKQLNDLYLYANRYRNSSADYYYEPPQYRFNMKKQLDSPMGLRYLMQNDHRINTFN